MIRDITEVGHTVRRKDNKWSKRLLDLCPIGRKISRQRPDRRWRVENEHIFFTGKTWQRTAETWPS